MSGLLLLVFAGLGFAGLAFGSWFYLRHQKHRRRSGQEQKECLESVGNPYGTDCAALTSHRSASELRRITDKVCDSWAPSIPTRKTKRDFAGKELSSEAAGGKTAPPGIDESLIESQAAERGPDEVQPSSTPEYAQPLEQPSERANFSDVAIEFPAELSGDLSSRNQAIPDAAGLGLSSEAAGGKTAPSGIDESLIESQAAERGPDEVQPSSTREYAQPLEQPSEQANFSDVAIEIPAEPIDTPLEVAQQQLQKRRTRSKRAQYRDRRGQKRGIQTQPIADPKPDSSLLTAKQRTPTVARLRLILHPARRTVSIALMLARAPGYPERIKLLLGSGSEVRAYSENRYDDVDLEWTRDLLSSEVRLVSEEGYQWLRSGRRVHIFSELPDEFGLVSVGSASLRMHCAIVCRIEDEAAVRSAATLCGSPSLISYDRWTGVPDGWVVLTGYSPTHAATSPLVPSMISLDPGNGAAIRLSGNLEVQPGSFAQGSPPRIVIEPFPRGARVTIDGSNADIAEDGSWQAAGWDAPGDHLIDVVPGPSMTYRIVQDPWLDGGWEHWDAHPERFPQSKDAPWARAQICGAVILCPSDEHVVAAEAMATVYALGLLHAITALWPRPDAPVAVGLLREAPAFLISSWGQRRAQGRIDWLAPPSPNAPLSVIDLQWAAAVHKAAARRLSISDPTAAGQDSWRRAREQARHYRKEGA